MKRNKLTGNIMICLGVIPLIIMTFWVDYIVLQSVIVRIISLLIFNIIFFGVSIPFIIDGIHNLTELKGGKH